MHKIHTRFKRMLGLSTSKNPYKALHPGLFRKKRPKTFKTEESARRWALIKGLKEGEYILKRVKKNKKFEVVMKDGKD